MDTTCNMFFASFMPAFFSSFALPSLQLRKTRQSFNSTQPLAFAPSASASPLLIAHPPFLLQSTHSPTHSSPLNIDLSTASVVLAALFHPPLSFSPPIIILPIPFLSFSSHSRSLRCKPTIPIWRSCPIHLNQSDNEAEWTETWHSSTS